MKKLLLLFIFISSCSGEENYSPMDIFMKAYKFDSTIEEVVIKDSSRSIHCTNYPEGCIPYSPKRFKIRLVEMAVIQYRSQSLACQAALKLDEYYVGNWIFDNVKNEPVLESFVKQVYNAKNPKFCK